MANPNNPLIVQSDKTLLLDVMNPRADECRDRLAPFCELIKSPEYIHTYRITPLSLWNARAAGMPAEEMVGTLKEYSRFDVPGNVLADLMDSVSRFGRLKLIKGEQCLYLKADDPILLTEVLNHKPVQKLELIRKDTLTVEVPLLDRGRVKQALLKAGFPVEDLAGYAIGDAMEFTLRDFTRFGGELFVLRDYQRRAADNFWVGGSDRGGSGVLALPCGAGKTIIGIDVMARARTHTLIVTTGITASRQWIREIKDKTNLTDDEIGEYSGAHKDIRPVTVATYQVLTVHRVAKQKVRREQSNEYDPFAEPLRIRAGRKSAASAVEALDLKEFPNLSLFQDRNWGLIIYDEVHLLPAPVFRVTAEIQARRRLGLTATLIREDGREDDVFSLIGPKKYDVPWRELEAQGWIAEAQCTEVRCSMALDERMEYAVAEHRDKYRISSTSVAKLPVVEALCEKHRDDSVLIIGQYLDQLDVISKILDAPIITGKTPQRDRDRIFGQFRDGELGRLVVSRVANFSIDLPDANVAIQVSGTFGSRQEEAQRLGRVLRPKKDGGQANFYAVVTRDTLDQEFALKRQLFLTEQGYRYNILTAEDVVNV